MSCARAGQERFLSITRVYYRDAHACIIMFDLTQRRSFENALAWKRDLDAKCVLDDGSPVPCILLANKVRVASWRAQTSVIHSFGLSFTNKCDVLYVHFET